MNAVSKILKSQGFRIIVAILVVTGAVYGFAFGLMAIKSKGTVGGEVFVTTDKYNIENTLKLIKKDEDFKILNLADIQFNDISGLATRDITFDTITKLIATEKPDLITMTGDQAWMKFKKQSVLDLIEFMDQFKILWAPVLGNHESDGNCDRNWIADQYAKSEYCVFEKGPNNIGGVGNYIINVMNSDMKILQSLIMMDSDQNTIKAGQLEWYEWAVKGANAYNASKSFGATESTVIMHIPTIEFNDAYKKYEEGELDGYGKNVEPVCYGSDSRDFFNKIKELSSTKNILVGHDHVNNSSIVWEGVRLTYGNKTGAQCYWVNDGTMNGGTMLRVTSNGSVNLQHVFLNPNTGYSKTVLDLI